MGARVRVTMRPMNRPLGERMNLNPESLRYILGLKLRHRRLDRGWGLKELANRTGMSVSYLSEIEKGRKYPKPDKLIQMAQALDISYDELVSPRVAEHLRPVRELFSSSFLQQFPFHLFGIEPEQVVGLVTEVPAKAGALLRTFLEIGQSYDVTVEHFLFAALRSYQQLRGNYFEEIEEAAEEFLKEKGWTSRAGVASSDLQAVLERRYGFVIDEFLLTEFPELADLRSVFVDGQPRRLAINPRLLPPQRAFALGRELGYLRLGHKLRSQTSGYVRVESFDQVINDFEAAYFSGAVLLNQRLLVEDLEALFSRPTWSAEAFESLVVKYETTPETFFYRLSQLLPRHFGFEGSFFVRFANAAGEPIFRLTKILNMSSLPIPLGIEPGEHYCRRWPGPSLLGKVASGHRVESTAHAHRCHFVAEDEEYLLFTLTRPLALAEATNTSISIGFKIDDNLRRRIAVCDDAAIVRREVHNTCERCILEGCEVRAADPVVDRAARRQEAREGALAALVQKAQT